LVDQPDLRRRHPGIGRNRAEGAPCRNAEILLMLRVAISLKVLAWPVPRR
jgi:hypothetical protein